MKSLILLAVFIIVALALFFALRPSGPRVTTIEHRREEVEKDDDDA